MNECTYHQWFWLLDHPFSLEPKKLLCVKVCQICGKIDWYKFPWKMENLEERIEKQFEKE